MINSGKVGVLPTDTLYGVVCAADNKDAVQRVYALKNRDAKPGTIIATSIDQLVDLGIKRRYLKAVENYWPGPISVVIPCGPEFDYLHQGKYSLAVRVVNDNKVGKLLNGTGPLLTSSANFPGKAPATTIQEAQNYFGDKVDFYVDGGDMAGRESSTVIRIVDDAIEVLRAGAVKMNENGRIQS
jgi:L-threonylcarbamoyladenylate synthase